MDCPAVYADAADLNSGCSAYTANALQSHTPAHSHAMGYGSQTQVDKLGKKHLYL